MKQYLDLLQDIIHNGSVREDRTGVGTKGVFGRQLRFNLQDGFPLLTTKKIHIKSVLQELFWLLRGETHVATLQAQGVTIWDEWATHEQCARFGRSPGDLGPIYGHQWRNFGATRNADGTYNHDGVDQITELVENLKKNPYSRRHIITGWHPKEAQEVALPPCHTLFQFYVEEDALEEAALSCQLYQRSADIFLGVPFNIASYAFLTHMIAHVVGLKPGVFVHTFGDVHLYLNHIEQARLQLSRDARPLPILELPKRHIWLHDWKIEDFKVIGYDPHPAIKAPVAV